MLEIWNLRRQQVLSALRLMMIELDADGLVTRHLVRRRWEASAYLRVKKFLLTPRP